MRLDDNELEVGLVTFNRAPFVKEWLNRCLAGCDTRNVNVVIYDSSTDDETKELIDRINAGRARLIGYTRVPAETSIGYKPMLAILGSSAKYVWVAGDSRYQDFAEMDEKVFPLLRQGVDFVTFYPNVGPAERPDIYIDKGSFLHDAFVSATCIGTSVFRTGLFDRLKRDDLLRCNLDDLFKDNYGFAWLGYFYFLFGECGKKAAYVDVDLHDILPNRKTQSWAKRFYACWCEDLCNIVDRLTEVYRGKEDVPRHVWDVMHLDSVGYCVKGRVGGDLNPETIERLVGNGMLPRCTDNVGRLAFFASAPKLFVKGAGVMQAVKARASRRLRAARRLP